MINYMQTNILDMLEYVGEDNCKNSLSSFVCPVNRMIQMIRIRFSSRCSNILTTKKSSNQRDIPMATAFLLRS